MGFFDRLKQGLTKTKEAVSEQVNQVFKVFVKVDEELFENLEEAFQKGTIYPDLYKPFEGRRCK